VPERRWPTHQDLIVCPQEDAEAFASPQDGRERQPPILKAVPPAVEEWSNPVNRGASQGHAATLLISSPGALRRINRISDSSGIGTYRRQCPGWSDSKTLRGIGLQIRVGLHTGEVEQRDSDVGDIAVHIAARVMAVAGPGGDPYLQDRTGSGRGLRYRTSPDTSRTVPRSALTCCDSADGLHLSGDALVEGTGRSSRVSAASRYFWRSCRSLGE
jgi:hypothetical protein